MRDIPDKTDFSGDVLSAAELNVYNSELKNIVTHAGITLDPADGPDTNTSMLRDSVQTISKNQSDLRSSMQEPFQGVSDGMNSAHYSFDDWDGVSGFLTGSHGFVVPYKKALSNVFTGFEVIGWEGAYFKNITDRVGLHWIKDRDAVTDNFLMDLNRGNYQFWESNTNVANQEDTDIIINKDEFMIGSAFSTINNSIISWNWHYPLAKAWHANGESSRKVPTPWGIVDSVESNANSGLTGDQVVIELYNPLTSNGCLLYIGNGANRTLDISGGITPEFMIAKILSTGVGTTYHAQFNGGTSPADYTIDINSTQIQQNDNTAWNDTIPTNSLISLGIAGKTNDNGSLCVLYYFSPIAGLQNFGGYTGNSNVNNQDTGVKDGMFFIKRRLGGGGGGDWRVFDQLRGSNALAWNLNTIESLFTGVALGSVTGIDINTAAGDININNDNYIYGHFGEQLVPQGNMDVYPANAITSVGDNNNVRITFEYEGAAALNSELLVYASRESTPDWVQGTLSEAKTLANGRKLLTADIDISGNDAGTSMRWRIATNETTRTEHNIRNLTISWR